jgi:hypothetical protein
MARKKRIPAGAAEAAAATTTTETGAAVAVAEPPVELPPIIERPAYIDGPPTTATGRSPLMDDEGREDPPKHWGNPYKEVFSCSARGFEMGEDRRFKQRVFRFAERPDPEVIQTLKEHGFTYRAAEKAWTIQANPDTRRLSEELAQQFAGTAQGKSR